MVFASLFTSGNFIHTLSSDYSRAPTELTRQTVATHFKVILTWNTFVLFLNVVLLLIL